MKKFVVISLILCLFFVISANADEESCTKNQEYEYSIEYYTPGHPDFAPEPGIEAYSQDGWRIIFMVSIDPTRQAPIMVIFERKCEKYNNIDRKNE